MANQGRHLAVFVRPFFSRYYMSNISLPVEMSCKSKRIISINSQLLTQLAVMFAAILIKRRKQILPSVSLRCHSLTRPNCVQTKPSNCLAAVYSIRFSFGKASFHLQFSSVVAFMGSNVFRSRNLSRNGLEMYLKFGLISDIQSCSPSSQLFISTEYAIEDCWY